MTHRRGPEQPATCDDETPRRRRNRLGARPFGRALEALACASPGAGKQDAVAAALDRARSTIGTWLLVDVPPEYGDPDYIPTVTYEGIIALGPAGAAVFA